MRDREEKKCCGQELRGSAGSTGAPVTQVDLPRLMEALKVNVPELLQTHPSQKPRPRFS
jgi:hypothetical protein